MRSSAPPCWISVLPVALCCSSAWANDWQWRFGGALAWTSDYVLRGVSQSDARPALQGDAHIEPWPQWTVGAWASTIRLPPNRRSTELDLYLNKQWVISQDLAAQFGYAHYSYLNDPRPFSYAYNEFSLSINWLDTWLLSASWSPDASLVAFPYGVKLHQQIATLEATYRRALPFRVELALGAGYFDALEQHEGSYSFGNAGLSRNFGPLRAELNWFWTQRESHRAYTPGPAGGPWAMTMIWEF